LSVDTVVVRVILRERVRERANVPPVVVESVEGGERDVVLGGMGMLYDEDESERECERDSSSAVRC
jgi:hypothetical protein